MASAVGIARATTAILPSADVVYRLMTDVPDHWLPFIPVHLAGSSRQVGLIEAVLPRPHSLAMSRSRRRVRACCRNCEDG